VTRVIDLIPGDLIHFSGRSSVFVARTEHPYYLGFAMVIWRMDQGDWSHDALLPNQELSGEVESATDEERRSRLFTALFPNRRR
jgi:hypothetical protein